MEGAAPKCHARRGECVVMLVSGDGRGYNGGTLSEQSPSYRENECGKTV
jgi:hypothetical protein